MQAEVAPGERVLIRDEGWTDGAADLCDIGGYQLDCIAVSETVRHRDVIYPTEIDEVTVLDPKDTQLVQDNSPRSIQSLLYLDANLRQTVPTDSAISIERRGAVNALQFQLVPTRRVLPQLRPRFLIADSAGLGKSLEAGSVVAELIRRGRGRADPRRHHKEHDATIHEEALATVFYSTDATRFKGCSTDAAQAACQPQL